MGIQRFHLKYNRKIIIAITLSLMMVFMAISVVTAALITISTTDNSASDWNGVSLFYSDPTGDLNGSCSGGTNQDDIIEVYVGSGPSGGALPDNIYFLVKLADTDPNKSPIQYHQISAFMDCPDSNGNYGQDNKDANVIYQTAIDRVVLCNGNQSLPDCYTGYPQNGPEGQKPTLGTSNFSFEWTGSYDKMADFIPPNLPALNCTDSNIAKIKVQTFLVDSRTGAYQCTFDDTGWRDFNSPTAVDIVSLENRSQRNINLRILSIGTLLAVIVIGFTGYYITRKTR